MALSTAGLGRLLIARIPKTSIEAITAEAGVAVRTVYSPFGAKAGNLVAICASDEDQKTRSMLRAKLNGRNHVMNKIITSLEWELTKPTRNAQAIYRAFAGPGVYSELILESGWTSQAFEDWVADALIRQLMDSASSITDTER